MKKRDLIKLLSQAFKPDRVKTLLRLRKTSLSTARKDQLEEILLILIRTNSFK